MFQTKILLYPSFCRYSTKNENIRRRKNSHLLSRFDPPTIPLQPPNQPTLQPTPSPYWISPRYLGGGCVSVTCEGCESFGTSSSCTYPGVCWSTRSIVAIHAVGFFRKKCGWFVDSLLSDGVQRERNGELTWNRWVGVRVKKREKGKVIRWCDGRVL